MAKRFITLTLILSMLLTSLSSCEIEGIGSKGAEKEYALFDENGNMLCDYYVSFVLLNERRADPNHGYAYVVHRYRKIEGVKGWKDLIYSDEAYQTEGTVNHVIAVYSSYSGYSGSFKSPTYGTPAGEAETIKMIPRTELKNGGILSYEDYVYFCAEVTEIKTDSLIVVSPLEGAIENSISDKLSVKIDREALGIKANDLSVGDRIRIFYDGGVWKEGINIPGAKRVELLQTEESGYPVSILGLITSESYGYDKMPLYEGAKNGTEFTDGTSPGALPVHVFTTSAELNSYSLSNSNFKYLTDNYTDRYFEEKALIFVYLTSPSISYVYGIEKLEISQGKLTLKVAEANAPEVPLDESFIHVICIETDLGTANSLTDFDVELIN